MVEIVTICDKSAMKTWAAELFGVEALPVYLFDDESYQGIVIGLKAENTFGGIAYGVIKKGDFRFFLHRLYVKKEHRSEKMVIILLKAILQAGRAYPKITCAVWNYMLPSGKSDAHIFLLKKILFCQIQDKITIRQYRMKTSDILKWKNFRLSAPGFIDKKGFQIVPWKKCEGAIKDKIRARERDGKPDKDYLSPFFEHESLAVDGDSSYVLVESLTGKPAGWMISGKISDQEFRVRRFYIYDEERHHMLGPAFIVYMAEKLHSLFEYLSFEIVDGNRQMETFIKKFVDEKYKLDCIKCNLIINFRRN